MYIYVQCQLSRDRPASLVGITERETREGKLGWHGNSTGFDRKKYVFLFPILRNEREKKDYFK